MKKFFIVTNPLKDVNYNTTKKILSFFKKNQFQYLLQNELAANIGEQTNAFVVSDCDVMLVIGGDGTILTHLEIATANNMDVVGVNMGKVGFLANVEKNNFEEKLSQIAKGEYEVENRMMIDVFAGERFIATGLNDAVFSKISHKGTIDFKVYVDDVFLAHYSSDGLIIAAPTGSTAYYLSAGGTVMNPKCETMGILPICPHSFINRGVIVSSDEKIKVQVNPNEVVLLVDGKDVVFSEDEITIMRSSKSAKFITFAGESFYSTMIKKIIESNNFRGGIS